MLSKPTEADGNMNNKQGTTLNNKEVIEIKKHIMKQNFENFLEKITPRV